MWEVVLDEIKRIARSRLFPIVIMFSFLFVVLIYRIFTIQIVNGEEYQQNAETDRESKIETKATRGNIYDRNGVLLAYNELSYTLQIEDNGELTTDEEKNTMIDKLIHYVEDLDGDISYEFPLEFDEHGRVSFRSDVSESSIIKFKVNAYSRKNADDLREDEKAADALTVYEHLRTKVFEISDEYTPDETLKIMSIRYILYINRYLRLKDGFVPITLSTNLSPEIVATLKENRAELPGVHIVEETNRVYKDSEYYAHILGYTGTISTETLQLKSEEGDNYYSSTDQIGKTGLEEKYEEQLRGKKGYQKVVKNSTGKITEILKTVEPVPGNDIYLTIDSELQKASYVLLEKELASVLLENIVNSKSTGSKGTSSDEIKIPIYDVFFALIDNNVISINYFQDPKASDLEKSIYAKFQNEQERVFSSLKEKMGFNESINPSSLSEEMQSYMKQVYISLKENEVLLTSKIDSEDEVYKKYVNGKIGLNSFLIHAIEKKWINLDTIDVGTDWYTTEELYQKLLDYTLELLAKNRDFSKLIYRNMIWNYQISGRDVCLLLFEQNVLKKDESSINGLKNGIVSPYTFIRNKIKSLEITPAQLALEPCSGSVVITDPNSGETLACVSYPSFDNNKLANTVDSAYYASLVTDKSSPFVNRATKMRIAPGSTFKTFSSIVALKEGVISTSTKIKDGVTFTKINPSPKCWSKYSHGSINVADAIGVSCNYFFYTAGFDMSKDSAGNYISNLGLRKIQKYAEEFGLSAKSGLEMSEDDPVISKEDAVRSMIGQGTNSFAPAHLARWATTVANEGTVYNLTLIDKIADVNGKTIENNEAKVYKKLDVSGSYWDAVKLGMYKVVNGPSSSI
ncbi:MAG: peptidase, partial [Clostridium sp.]|nr:peptidase [Clostridium sp.]